MMVGPFLIDKLDAIHFLSGILDTMKDRMNLSRCMLVVKEILACWVAMALTNALCKVESLLVSYSSYPKLGET